MMVAAIERSRKKMLRTMRVFSEEEIFIPDGPFAGTRFKCSTQPYAGLFFDLVDSGQWTDHYSTGPVQSGKTLTCCIIPILYHLFEQEESVIFGIPDKRMADDKWRSDILPVIQRTRYAALLPKQGPGSKGGTVDDKVEFRNGATLKFMGAKGDDKSRAGYTARVFVGTEIDGYDTSRSTSREADPLSQMIKRTKAYGPRRRVYCECTTSIEEGRIWVETTSGTNTRIALPCPKCGEFVTLEREHIKGWEGEDNEIDAGEKTHYICYECGHPWSDDDRRVANKKAILVHKGQSIEKGKATGDLPKTNTLGFRWSAVNNLFWPSSDLGIALWKAQHAQNEENAEKDLCQFYFAVPYIPPILDTTQLDPRALQKRFSPLPKGVVGADVEHTALGIDVGKWQCHWAYAQWGESRRGSIVDYGAFDVPSHDMDAELALLAALREFREQIEGGWYWEGNKVRRKPEQVWIDSGYLKKVVYEFCAESGTRYRPIKGYGVNQKKARTATYRKPTKKSKEVAKIGEEYHFVVQGDYGIHLIHLNSDHWKSWLHSRLQTPPDKENSLTLFDVKELPDNKFYHMRYTQSLTAEKQVQELIEGKGLVTKWRVVKANKSHWLDSSAYACAALHFCGVRLIKSTPKKQQAKAQKAAPRRQFTTPDGQPFLVTER